MIENPKLKVLVGIIGIIIIVGGLLAVKNFLSQSKLIVHGESPYSVTIFDVGKFPCESDPCVVPVAKGAYEVLIEKKGYKDARFGIALGNRETFEQEIEFELIPYIEELDADEGAKIFTEKPDGTDVELQKHPGHKQALFVDGVETVYFSREIEDYDIYLLKDDKTVAIVEHDEKDSIYMVDTKTKDRKKILVNEEEITEVRCSYDTNWCLIQDSQIKLLNIETGNVEIEETLQIPLNQAVWSDKNTLFFISKYKSEEELSEPIYYVQEYDPKAKTYDNIMTTSLIKAAPESVKLGQNYEVFFRSGQEYFGIYY
jgi:hypothetical protein